MKKLAVVIGIGLVGGFWLMRAQQKVPKVAVTTPERPTAPQPKETKQTAATPAKQAPERLAARNLDHGPSTPPVTQAFRVNQGNIVMDFKVEEIGCSLGDFDMMQADGKMRGTDEVLFTVEALDKEQGAPLLAEKVAIKDFIVGKEWIVPVPEKLANVPLGVFLCSDSARENRCLGKKVEDINQLWETYRKALARQGKYPTDDRILVFQYLHRQDDAVRFLPADSLVQVGAEGVKSALLALNGDGAKANRISQQVYHHLDVLKPMLGRPSKDSIHFPVPKGKCP